GDPGVVHQHVELAVGLGRRCDLAAVRILTHVALHQPGLGAGGLDGLGGRLGLLTAPGVIEQQGLGAALGRTDGDGRAEAGAASRYENHLALEVAHLLLLPVSDAAGPTPLRHVAERSKMPRSLADPFTALPRVTPIRRLDPPRDVTPHAPTPS